MAIASNNEDITTAVVLQPQSQEYPWTALMTHHNSGNPSITSSCVSYALQAQCNLDILKSQLPQQSPEE
jgi:hypothetical protein